MSRFKSRTPDSWGAKRDKHLRIVLCDWPVGLPLLWRLGGVGSRGLWRLHVDHHGDHVSSGNLPAPGSSVTCTQIAETPTYENSLAFFVFFVCFSETFQQATERASTTTAEKHAKAPEPDSAPRPALARGARKDVFAPTATIPLPEAAAGGRKNVRRKLKIIDKTKREKKKKQKTMNIRHKCCNASSKRSESKNINNAVKSGL